MKLDLMTAARRLGHYFNLRSDREDETEVVRQVSAGVVFRGTNLWILICAIFIASLGLNVNSTAVIIGAMLVSPLMGPILGMGLSVAIGDFDLLRRALKNYGVATLISVATAALYFLISPLNEARSELLARTTPSLYDVLIAFFGGAAGVLALTTKSKGQVIPGVAIATALMPPLCTAGYGLATAQWSYFLGAFYLFFINTVFIAIATFLGVKLMRFHTVSQPDGKRMRTGRRALTTVVVLTMLPAAYMTWDIVRQDIAERNVRAFINRELQQSGTQILNSEVHHDTLRVVAVGRPIAESELAEARSRMDSYKLKGMTLNVIQGADAEGLAAQVRSLVASAEGERQRLSARSTALEQQLAAYSRFDTLSAAVSAEAALLFPDIAGIGIGLVGGKPVALVRTDDGAHRRTSATLHAWLRTRTGIDELEIITVDASER